MENRVGHSCGVGLVGFEDKEEAFVVGCNESGESGDFLEGLVVFDVGELEGSDEGGETFGAESRFVVLDEMLRL